jgi:putative FmdB family regulatory protein
MPIYEYECGKCGHHVEVLQKFSDPPITECEECHSKMKKLISQSTFHLKGTGWYVTDYASKNSPGASESKSAKTPPGKENSGSTAKEKVSETKGSTEGGKKSASTDSKKS